MMLPGKKATMMMVIAIMIIMMTTATITLMAAKVRVVVEGTLSDLLRRMIQILQ